MKNGILRISFAALVAMFVLSPLISAAGLTVLTVPWEPTSPLSPHTSYPITSSTEVTVTLGATVPSGVTTGDTVSVDWKFGDGSPDAVFPLANIYDISTTHQYPATAAVGTAWTATVTVTDSTQSTTGTGSYYLIQEANNLQARVNVAIDNGLWYLHQTMWRNSTVVSGNTIQWGGWIPRHTLVLPSAATPTLAPTPE